MKRKGPTQGRTFLRCPRPTGSQCAFFEWSQKEADEGTSQTFEDQVKTEKARKLDEEHQHLKVMAETLGATMATALVSTMQEASRASSSATMAMAEAIQGMSKTSQESHRAMAESMNELKKIQHETQQLLKGNRN